MNIYQLTVNQEIFNPSAPKDNLEHLNHIL